MRPICRKRPDRAPQCGRTMTPPSPLLRRSRSAPCFRATRSPLIRTFPNGSACLAREREWQVQLDAIVHHLGRDAAPLAAFEAHQPIAFHGPQCAREV